MTTTAIPVSDERTRTPVTYVPMSVAALPPVDGHAPPWPGRQLDVGGLNVHVRCTPGVAERTAVFVHGLGGSSTNWTDFAGQLSSYAAGYAVDLPGFGRSEPPKGYRFTIEEQANTVAKLIESLGAPVDLFGNSMGGTISVRVAARHPELVRTLTLISPGMPDLRPYTSRLSDPRLVLAYLPGIGRSMRRQLAKVPPREQAAAVLRLCFADPTLVAEHRLDEAAAELVEWGSRRWANRAISSATVSLFRAWLAPPAKSLWRLLPEISVPSLVIWGTDDKLVTVRKAPRTAALLPNSRLLIMPGVGHVAQMERPRSVARAVLGMWEAVEDGRW
ncbi:MAG: alpha/beta hydrolase [Sciscionella sp.]|nr:alpha/beta hydrolase [Sciscionella sp.]